MTMPNCTICRQPIRPGEQSGEFGGGVYHYNPADCVRAVARRCAEMLRTKGVMLSICPGETRDSRVKRYALAMAEKIEAEFGLTEETDGR